jgi:lysylphosphatidylglycerol synthetase-like protein (DUF2156 family)
MDKKNSGNAWIYKVAYIISLAVTGVFLALLVTNLAQQAPAYVGAGGGAADLMVMFYQNNGFMLSLFMALLIGLAAVKKRRETFAKTFLWAILIFGVLNLSELINLFYYFPSLGASSAMDVISIYAPAACAAAAVVTLLAQWDASDKKKANMVTAVCAIVAIFMTVYYSARMLVVDQGFGDVQTIRTLAGVMGLVSVTFLSVLAYVITLSRKQFDMVAYAMTGDEAELVESVEDKVESAVEQFEEEILENMAREVKQEGGDREKIVIEEEMVAADEEAGDVMIGPETAERETDAGEDRERPAQD